MTINRKLLKFIIVIKFLVIFYIKKSHSKKSNLDDVISQTDYLLTIYSSTNRKPCLYFSENRYSQPESSLINCTWYKTNACCKRTEVASVFENMFTLNRASEVCMNMMNYMMCFFCSPNQYIWYREMQISVCLRFCEELVEKCKEAEYNGNTIGEIYKDGASFCRAQDFKVISSNHQCFDFDSNPFSTSHQVLANAFLIFCIGQLSSFIL